MAYDMNIMNSIKDIASLAYGSGVFEKEKGGKGYMGAFVDSTTGAVRVVKMLTHRSEYGAVKTAGGEAAFAAVNTALAQSTETLKAALLKIAGKSDIPGMKDRIQNMIQDKPLLSRQVIARVVNTLTEGDADFSWRDAAAKARTMADTTLKTVADQNRQIDDGLAIGGDRFRTLGHELDTEIAGTQAENVAESAAKIRTGRFDQSWRQTFKEVAYRMNGTLSAYIRAPGFMVEMDGVEPNAKLSSLDEKQALFMRLFREELAKSVEAKNVFPLNDTQKMRLMARAYKKAFVMTTVAMTAKAMLQGMDDKFGITEKRETKPGRFEKLEAAKERILDLKALSDGYDIHFGYDELSKPLKEADLNSSHLLRGLFATDALTDKEVVDSLADDHEDLTDAEPRLRDGETFEADGFNKAFENLEDDHFPSAKKLMADKLNAFTTWFLPSSGFNGLDLSNPQQAERSQIVRDNAIIVE